MLDDRINHMVLEHFSTRRPRDLNVDLDQLFYPDYGLASFCPGRTGLAQALLRMSAHVSGARVPWSWQRIWSVILYGPPGTGKTTMAEALAKSTRKTFVEVTPSDIMVGGSEEAESRARIVFNALSMLTDCVILFDEFEPVIQRRAHQGGTPTSVFEFMTPGMLPKLKKLHDMAGRQRVAFFLATNRIGSLDEAAIREGRFDLKIGVYPPDLLSRAGRLAERTLAAVVVSGSPRRTNRRMQRTRPRIAEVVDLMAKGAMNRLGKSGWFSGNVKDGLPLAYVVSGEGTAPQREEPEQEISPDLQGVGRDAEREWQEWTWVNEWDALFTSDVSWDGLQRALRRPPRLHVPPNPHA